MEGRRISLAKAMMAGFCLNRAGSGHLHSVQEVMTHFKFLYKMGHYFLDIQYMSDDACLSTFKKKI